MTGITSEDVQAAMTKYVMAYIDPTCADTTSNRAKGICYDRYITCKFDTLSEAQTAAYVYEECYQIIPCAHDQYFTLHSELKYDPLVKHAMRELFGTEVEIRKTRDEDILYVRAKPYMQDIRNNITYTE